MVSKSKALGKSSLIFVTVGSTNFPFDRLFIAIDSVLEKLDSQAKLVVQTGCSNYKWTYKNIELFRYLEPKKMEIFFEEADKIITHGGFGTLFLLSSKAKYHPFIVARLKKFHEHINNHQQVFVKKLRQMFPHYYSNLFSFDEIKNKKLQNYIEEKPKKNLLPTYLFNETKFKIENLAEYINKKI